MGGGGRAQLGKSGVRLCAHDLATTYFNFVSPNTWKEICNLETQARGGKTILFGFQAFGGHVGLGS